MSNLKMTLHLPRPFQIKNERLTAEKIHLYARTVINHLFTCIFCSEIIVMDKQQF